MSPDDVAALALRVRVSDLERGTTAEHTFQRSPVTVGRGELNDLQLDRPYVSSWHALIHFDEAGIRFVDLGSTNGTFLADVRLVRNEATPIAPGQALTVGRLRLELSRGAADAAPANPIRPMTSFAKRVARAGPPPADAVSPAAASALKLLAGKPSSGPRPAVAAPPSVAPRPTLVAPPLAAPPLAPPAPPPAPAAPAAVAPPPPPAGPSERAAPAAAPEPPAPAPFVPSAPAPFVSPPRPEGLGPAVFPPRPESARAPQPFPEFPTLVPAAPVASAPAAPPPAAPAQPPPAAAPGGSTFGDEVLSLVRSFAESYLPPEAVPTSAAGVERLLTTLAEVMETAVRGFIELRSGHEQFADEMGLRVARGDGAIGRTADAGRLLGWLLEPVEGEARARQLAAGFADLMIHQVALLNGIRAGAQALVAELSPAETARRLERDGSITLPVWPLRQLAVLRALEERHGDFADEESAVTGVLFGKEFARAYSSVSGRRAGPSGGDEAPGSREDKRKP